MANRWIRKLGLGMSVIMTVSQLSGIAAFAAPEEDGNGEFVIGEAAEKADEDTVEEEDCTCDQYEPGINSGDEIEETGVVLDEDAVCEDEESESEVLEDTEADTDDSEYEIFLEGDGSAEESAGEYEDLDLYSSVQYEDLNRYYATASYSVDAALDYAAYHWNDGQGACAEFVCRCVQAGGLNIDIKTGTGPAYREICSKSGLSLENLSLNSGGVYVANTGANAGKIARGDVVLVWCNSHDICPHMMICSGFDSQGRALYYAHNNKKNNEKVGIRGDWYSGHNSNCSMSAKVIRLSTLRSAGRQPVGEVFSVEGLRGDLWVKGYAYDPDDPSTPIDVHVYVGGGAGSGAPCYTIKANSTIDGVDGAHGFNQGIRLSSRGTFEVHIYAIDIGETYAGNPEIWSGNVTVPEATYYINCNDTIDMVSGGYSFGSSSEGKIYAGERAVECYVPENDYIKGAIINSGNVGTEAWVSKNAGHISLPVSLRSSSGEILYTKHVDVTIRQGVTDVVMNQSGVTLTVGEQRQIGVSIYPDNAYNKALEWESSDPNVVEINPETGVAIAKNTGVATITAYSGLNKADHACWEAGRTKATCQVTVKAAGSNDPDPYDNGITAFVTRMYNVCLNRDPDAPGLNSWTGHLQNGTMYGADIAEAFIFSQEMINKNLSNTEFVSTLYYSLMGRDPDASGLYGWVVQLSSGNMSRHDVTKLFVESPEFGEICANYGIVRGTFNASAAPIEKFVTRFYNLCLERDPDQPGLYNWVNNLQMRTMNGAQIAANFFFSPEMNAKNLSNGKYIELLYNTMMGRPSDEAGKQYWLSCMAGGMTKEQVLNGFIVSPEFTGICATYGIERGNL